MIKNFNNFNNMNESKYEKEENELIDKILDRMSDVGFDNLSSLEKEILTRKSRGESIEEYIDKDEQELSFDKHGHILINGTPYTEWSMKQKENDIKENDEDDNEWKSIKKESGPKLPDYRVRVYKNNNSNTLYYYIFFVNGKNKGDIKKFTTIRDNDHLFGKMTSSKSWYENRLKNNLPPYTMEEFHEKKLLNEYDRFKDLKPNELNEFETLLILRKKFISGLFAEENDSNKKSLKYLTKLFNKFSNI